MKWFESKAQQLEKRIVALEEQSAIHLKYIQELETQLRPYRVPSKEAYQSIFDKWPMQGMHKNG